MIITSSRLRLAAAASPLALALSFVAATPANAQTETANLILVGRADAFEGRANFIFPQSFFLYPVNVFVGRQDQLGFAGDV